MKMTTKSTGKSRFMMQASRGMAKPAMNTGAKNKTTAMSAYRNYSQKVSM